jgi:hypothetical protein
MNIVQLIDEDFVNYKKASMVIGFPKCTFKCDKECGQKVCQNSELANSKTIDISIEKLVNRYIENEITNSVVLQGLEPFDSFDDLLDFIDVFRNHTNDDIVIYTGYNEDEIEEKIKSLQKYENIIVKFGRFIPDKESKYDELLGINLASPNQYAKQIS